MRSFASDAYRCVLAGRRPQHTFPSWVVRKRLIVHGIGIKVIVNMHAVDVVSLDDIHQYTQRVFASFGFTWIEPRETRLIVSVTFDQRRFGLTDMVGGFFVALAAVFGPKLNSSVKMFSGGRHSRNSLRSFLARQDLIDFDRTGCETT